MLFGDETVVTVYISYNLLAILFSQVVIRSKTSLTQPGGSHQQPTTRRRSGSPASATAPFLDFPSQMTPGVVAEGERLARVTVQRRSASVSPTTGVGGQSSSSQVGVVLDESTGTGN